MVWLLAGSRSQPALPASQSLSLTNHKSIAGVEKCDGAGAGQHGDTQTGPGRDSLANATARRGTGGRVMPHGHAGPGGPGHCRPPWLQGPAPSVARTRSPRLRGGVTRARPPLTNCRIYPPFCPCDNVPSDGKPRPAVTLRPGLTAQLFISLAIQIQYAHAFTPDIIILIARGWMTLA